MIAMDTINSLLNEANQLEAQAKGLREAAKSLKELSSKRIPGKPMETNGALVSSIKVSLRKWKKKTEKSGEKTGKKRKYTKRSKFWTKKK